MGGEALLMIINRKRRRFMASRSPFRKPMKTEVSAVLSLMSHDVVERSKETRTNQNQGGFFKQTKVHDFFLSKHMK